MADMYFRSLFAAAAAAVTLILSGPSQAASTELVVDPEHTSVVFLVDHLGYARLFGRFGVFEGTVLLDDEEVERSSIALSIRAESVDTGHERRDQHLRSPDFFNAVEFPEIRFRSTSVESTGEDSALVTGDLTLLGVTRAVVLEVTFNERKPHPLTGVDTAGFSARTAIRRSEFGMRYALGAIGDEVELWLEIEAIAPQ
jgi:polyisoprenoid-binding protein YceI